MRPPYFPIEPTELRGNWTFATIAPGEHEIEGFEVLAREIPHKGGRTFGYRVSDGHATLAYLPDHSPTALGPGEDGWGEYHPAALELARDADVLVHDSPMFPQELAAQATSAMRSPTTPSSWASARAWARWCCSTTATTAATTISMGSRGDSGARARRAPEGQRGGRGDLDRAVVSEPRSDPHTRVRPKGWTSWVHRLSTSRSWARTRRS